MGQVLKIISSGCSEEKSGLFLGVKMRGENMRSKSLAETVGNRQTRCIECLL